MAAAIIMIILLFNPCFGSNDPPIIASPLTTGVLFDKKIYSL